MSFYSKDSKSAVYKKAMIACAFGIIGYFINAWPIHLQLTDRYSLTILAGLIPPMIITVLWGWRYGLISALLGGVESLWFAVMGQGYAAIYSVFLYAAWVIWHGYFSNLRKKNAGEEKWYQNIFSVELIFRVIFEAGYLILTPYLYALNPPAWSPSASAVSLSPDWMCFHTFFRFLFGYVLFFLLRLVCRFTSVGRLFDERLPAQPGKSILHIALFFGLAMIFLQSVGAAYFNPEQGSDVLDYFLNFGQPQTFNRCVFLISLFGFGFALQYYFNKSTNTYNQLKETSTTLQRHEDDINHVLQLASDIGKAEKIDPSNFLNNLLKASLDIIPESDYGFAFRCQNDEKVIISQKGHSAALIGTRVNLQAWENAQSDILLLDSLKARLLSTSTAFDYFNIRENLNDAKESMLILCQRDQTLIAGIILGVSGIKHRHFSKDSLKIGEFLRDITDAFYSYLYLAEEREDTYKDIIRSSLKILSLHNAYTKDHSTGVANLSREIALCMNFGYKEAETIYWAGMVHDIGKILISDDILDKGDKLTAEEFEIIKNHTVLGYETFRESPNLTDISKYIFHHHEKWDGTGYPYGLSEKNIPLPSRILSVADVFDALIHDRPYRKAISVDEALNYIRDNAGVQFDPDICEVFSDNFDSIYKNTARSDRWFFSLDTAYSKTNPLVIKPLQASKKS